MLETPKLSRHTEVLEESLFKFLGIYFLIPGAFEKLSCPFAFQEGQMTENATARWDWLTHSDIWQLSPSGKPQVASQVVWKVSSVFLSKDSQSLGCNRAFPILYDSWILQNHINLVLEQGRTLIFDSNVPTHVPHLRRPWFCMSGAKLGIWFWVLTSGHMQRGPR